jgi:hypothetical protein
MRYRDHHHFQDSLLLKKGSNDYFQLSDNSVVSESRRSLSRYVNGVDTLFTTEKHFDLEKDIQKILKSINIFFGRN